MNRKKYTKPEIAVERFELTQIIAAGCTAANPNNEFGHPTHYMDQNSCYWEGETAERYFNSNMACDVNLEPGQTINGICYHAPANSNTFFGSM